MSKNRWINTKFWSDGYIGELDAIEKLLFLYLLTNERTTVAGVYELPRKIMSVETGIELSNLNTILNRFERDGKVVTFGTWVRLMNSDAHQNVSNPKIKIGIKNVLEKLPTEVRDRLCVDYPYPSNNLDSDLDSDLDLIKADKPPAKEKKVQEPDEISKLYYETVTVLALPTRNHNNLRTRIRALEKEVGKEMAMAYLQFVRQHYPTLEDDGFKPRLNEALDIYAKRMSIRSWIERKLIEQGKPTTVGGRPVV